MTTSSTASIPRNNILTLPHPEISTLKLFSTGTKFRIQKSRRWAMISKNDSPIETKSENSLSLAHEKNCDEGRCWKILTKRVDWKFWSKSEKSVQSKISFWWNHATEKAVKRPKEKIIEWTSVAENGSSFITHFSEEKLQTLKNARKSPKLLKTAVFGIAQRISSINKRKNRITTN